MLTENSFQLVAQMMSIEKKIENTLRQRGYKITPQRRTIIAAITAASEHLTPAAVYEVVRQQNRDIGLVTIYRTLEILAELGLICEIHIGGNCRSYSIRRPSEHHHHLICSDCGTVIDFTDCDLRELETRLSKETSFKIKSHLLEFLGQCRKCREAVAIG